MPTSVRLLAALVGLVSLPMLKVGAASDSTRTKLVAGTLVAVAAVVSLWP